MEDLGSIRHSKERLNTDKDSYPLITLNLSTETKQVESIDLGSGSNGSPYKEFAVKASVNQMKKEMDKQYKKYLRKNAKTNSKESLKDLKIKVPPIILKQMKHHNAVELPNDMTVDYLKNEDRKVRNRQNLERHRHNLTLLWRATQNKLKHEKIERTLQEPGMAYNSQANKLVISNGTKFGKDSRKLEQKN